MITPIIGVGEGGHAARMKYVGRSPLASAMLRVRFDVTTGAVARTKFRE
jgi:hypothetical protein